MNYTNEIQWFLARLLDCSQCGDTGSRTQNVGPRRNVLLGCDVFPRCHGNVTQTNDVTGVNDVNADDTDSSYRGASVHSETP